MDLLMNGLLMAATLFAGGYCWVLARRVQDLKSLDRGLGGAIVTLTRQVELARTTLDEARASSRDTRHDLAQLVAKADGAAGQLKLLLAAAPLPARLPLPAPAGDRRRPPPRQRRTHPTRCPGAGAAAGRRRSRPSRVARTSPSRALWRRSRTRSAAPEPVAGAPRSEDELLEALSALAGGR